MRCLLTIVWLLAAVEMASAEGPAEFYLTRDGKPAATIVTAAEPSPVAVFAAAELQHHVHEITGATLPIATEEADVAGPRILVGPGKSTRALSIQPERLKTQGYLIRFLPDTLVLLGKEAAGAPAAVPSLPGRGDGRLGRALRFDGKTQQWTVAACGFNDEAGTMEAWVWLPVEKAGRPGTILRLDSPGPWTYHIVQRDTNTSRISYTTYDGKQGYGVASGELAPGWHHIVATHDAGAGKMELLVDGRSAGTAKYVKTFCKDAALSIGGVAAAAGAAPGNPFQGLIDEVRISKTVRNIKDAAGGPYPLDENTTALFHGDEPGGPPRNSVPGLDVADPPDLFGSNGTLYAVYDLLERYCDVRWYAPGKIGLVCPKTPTLAVRARDLERAPAMIHRTIAGAAIYLPGPPETVPSRDVQVWKLRMRMGGQPFGVCHSFYGYYDRYLKQHPEWFAQGYKGQPPQMCYTNPEFIRQVVQDARDYFDGKGAKAGATAAGDCFGLVPMDNMSWCKCPRCQAELNKAEEKNPQFNNGKASDYVFNFVNQVAREVRKTHPGKRIGALAYSDYAYYPEKSGVEPNVVVQMCLHTRNWWCPSMEANDRKVLREWREHDPQRPLYLWLYYCFPALNAHFGNFRYFPGYFAHAVVPQMKLYHDAKIDGIFLENSSECGESYLMDQLEFYVTFKLADDPTLDGNRLIDEFFARYYGAAGAPMKELYCAIEKTFSDPASYPVDIQKSPAHQHQTKELAWGSLGTKERMEQFGRLMAQARAAAKTPEEKERVSLFERGQWQYMTGPKK
jgi:hypothetical protein